jgi:hypothetical protein
VRVVGAYGVDAALRDRLALPGFATPFWLFPLRDWLSVVETGASFLINQVTWRAHKLAAGGAVIRPAPLATE